MAAPDEADPLTRLADQLRGGRAAVLVVISLVRLARNGLRHFHQPPAPAPVPVA